MTCPTTCLPFTSPIMTISIRQLAKEAGVSRQTVSSVLNGRGHLYRDSTSQRVLEVAKRLNYRPSAAGKAVFSGRTRQVGTMLINTARTDREYVNYNPSTFETLVGANARLQAEGYTQCMVSVGDLGDEGVNESRVFQEHLLDGVLMIGKLPDGIEKRITKLEVPAVWVDGNIWQSVSCIRRDEVGAGRLAAEQAVAAGYRHLVYVGLPPMPRGDHYSAEQRWQGVREACGRATPEVKLDSIIFDTGRPSDFDFARIKPALSPGCAIVAYAGEIAVRVHLHMAGLGLAAGVDYGLCSCEDAGSIGHTLPNLARVGFDRFTLGYMAADMLLADLEGADNPGPQASQLIPDRWIEGDTLAAS